MEKFVGNVNGKSFDNKEDFDKAATEAIKSGEGNLAISYYYKTVEDVKQIEDKREEVKDGLPEDECQTMQNNTVRGDEYLLNKHSEYQLNKNGECEYPLKEDLARKLMNASNKDEITKTVQTKVQWINGSIAKTEKDIKNLNKYIGDLQHKLGKQEEYLEKLNAKKGYYNLVQDVVSNDITAEAYDKYNDECGHDSLQRIVDTIRPEFKKRASSIISTYNDLFDLLDELGIKFHRK